MGLKCFEESNQRIAICRWHGAKIFTGDFRFTIVPKNGFSQIARAAIVQKKRVAVDFGNQTDSPERGSAPVTSACVENGSSVTGDQGRLASGSLAGADLTEKTIRVPSGRLTLAVNLPDEDLSFHEKTRDSNAWWYCR